MLEDDYDKNYSFGGNFLNWLGNGLSGGGWSKGDFLKNRGITDETDQYGKAGYFGNSSMGELRNAGSEYNKGRLAQLEAGKGLFSGVPIIGDLLSAPAQVVSAGKDLAESGTSKWQNGKRDWLSDVGALGETALDVATLGAGSGAKAGAKTLGKTIGKGALLGAGYGLTGGLNEMGAKDFDLGRLALNTGIGAGVGGGIAGLGYGLGKAWNKYSQPSSTQNVANMPVSNSKELTVYSGPKATTQEYQNALKILNENGIDLTSPEAMKKSYRSASIKLHPDQNGGVETAFKQLNDANRLIYGKDGSEMLQNILRASESSPATASAPTISFVQKLKNFGYNIPNLCKDLGYTQVGTNVANLLKTKKGKVILGGSAGLTLAQLMNNKNKNSGQLSDEEMQELYNYIYGGQ